MRTGFKSTLLGIELGTLEVKGKWSDHYTTEAPITPQKLHLHYIALAVYLDMDNYSKN